MLKKNGVERAERHSRMIFSHQAQKALLHLTCSRFGKRNDQDGGRRNAAVLYKVLHSSCNDSGFARTRACKDEQRSILMTDRHAL